MRIIAWVALAGCYYTGNFHVLEGSYAHTGCLDLGLSFAHDALARDPVVAFSFGNRCSTEQVIDLSAARVVATRADGELIELSPDDPHHELRPMHIEAWTSGSEEIAYVGSAALDLTAPICIDVSKLDPRATAAQPLDCFHGIGGDQ